MKKKSLFLSVILFLNIVLGCMTGCRTMAFLNDPYPEYKELKRVKGDTYELQGVLYKANWNISPYEILEEELVAKTYLGMQGGIKPVFSSVLDVERNVLGISMATFYKEGFEMPAPKELSFDMIYGWDVQGKIPLISLSEQQEGISFEQLFVEVRNENLRGEDKCSNFYLRTSEYPYLALFIFIELLEEKIYVSMDLNYCRFYGIETPSPRFEVAQEYQETFRDALETKISLKI